MGVRLLLTFLEKFCPGACRPIDIEDLANDYREKTGKEPVIVVDGSSWYRILNKDLDCVCGGQCKEYADLVRAFAKKFKGMGIKLVVFFDGITPPEKRALWAKRRGENVEKAVQASRMIKAGYTIQQVRESSFFDAPSVLKGIMTFILLDEGFEIRQSYMEESDTEMADFAARNDCFAILSEDTDFIIFEGAHYFLSAKHMKLDDMTTILYDRRGLASALNIRTQQLPLLATLMGNDIINFSPQLKEFHQSITGRVYGKPYAPVLVEKLSDFIRPLPHQDADTISRILSRRVFGSDSRAKDIKKSILSYKKNENSSTGKQSSEL